MDKGAAKAEGGTPAPHGVNGVRVAVHRAAGKLFQMNGPATTKRLISSVVLVLGTDSNPVPADLRCRLTARKARQETVFI